MNKVIARARKKFDEDQRGAIQLLIYGFFFLCYLLYELVGLTNHSNLVVVPFAVLCFIAMLAVIWFRPAIEKLAEFKYFRPISHILFILIGFFLLEYTYNAAFFDMAPDYTDVNIAIVAVLYGVVCLVGQRTKLAITLFLVVCFVLGLANYFVILFKGMPILPSDFFALSTAASVGAGYSYMINDNVIVSFIVLLASCLLVSFLPKAKFTVNRLVGNSLCAVILVMYFGYWFNNYDIEERYECTVDVWSSSESYAQQGSTLCFLKRAQDLELIPPSGHSLERVGEILSVYQEIPENIEDVYESQPTVIVVMNETFSNLSLYDSVTSDYEGPRFYNSISDAVLKGNTYVSALGGGTCNSEFEFLTGSSMANLGRGVYPYVLYDLSGSPNLAGQFSVLGYDTTAIHPAEATNWRRNSVYEQFGFDAFIDEKAFNESDTLRGLTTDKATYELILDLLAQNENPQFIFDVTIQNHGGYKTGEIPEEFLNDLGLNLDAETDAELLEYLACIQQSDRDLEFFIGELQKLDREVVLCFFGDHQPDFSDALSEQAYGKPVSEFTLDEVQSRYTVPYMIWANYDAGGKVSPSEKGMGMLGSEGYSYEMLQVVSDSLVALAETADKAFDVVLDHPILDQEKNEAASVQTAALSTAPPVNTSTSTSRDSIRDRIKKSSQNISLNYLGANLVDITGLPLTNYQKYLLEIQTVMPVVNLNGFRDRSGMWYWMTDDSVIRPVFEEYAMIQYENLFSSV